MCEYCNGEKNHLSFPSKIEYDDGTYEFVCYGLHIDKENEKIVVFVANFSDIKNKEKLFSQTINNCPFCGEKLGV